jgi:hypothetical protein
VRPARSLFLALLLASFACSSFPEQSVLLVQTTGGQEVAVSTPHGIVFAGRTSTEGMARIVGFFGDGPAIETVEIVPLAPQLCTADPEIRFFEVELSFEPPRPGETLRLAGYVEGARWAGSGRVVSDEGGVHLEGGSLPDSAAAFREEEDRWRLVALVTSGEGGRASLVGPETLWRVLFRPRPYARGEEIPRRPDVR